jgi:hypothetical protein
MTYPVPAGLAPDNLLTIAWVLQTDSEGTAVHLDDITEEWLDSLSPEDAETLRKERILLL